MRWRIFKGNRKETFPQTQSFFTLTPKSDARNIDSYATALSFALGRSEIRNIAVTGKYGAGKSTFLRTFFKRRKDVLWISLASFLKGQQSSSQADDDGTPAISDAYESRTERLLEFSIIQQMFYTAKPSDLPASRYKRLSVPPVAKFWNIALLSCLTVVAAVGLLQPDFLVNHIFGSVKETLFQCRHIIFWGSLLTAFFLAVYALRILRDATRGSRSVKVSLQNLGVELDGRGSIFNRMLDEIIYFFETTNYGTVIFEDIDRFGDTEIFTKLREINQLVNNAKQIAEKKKPIRFIYALRDDIFSNKDKVKFFDFLIPILPLINASNSDAVLINDLKEVGLADGDDLRGIVKAISPYISDMRLLGNVINEFKIYRQMIPDCAKPDSLLGMIVFKNFYPAEFANLHDNRGALIQVFELVEKIKLAKEQEFSEKISQIEKRIKDAKDNAVGDVEVLNLAFAAAISRQCGQTPQVLINQNWRYLCSLNSAELSLLFDQGFRCNCTCGVNWQNVEKAIPGAMTYKERKALIIDKSKERQSEFKNQIASLKMTMSSMVRMTAKQMIGDGYLSYEEVSNLLPDSIESDKLLFFALLSGGYIAEDYTHYISVFHPGRLGREDYYFKINVTKGARANWEVVLEHPDEVVSDLDINWFSSHSILNFSIFDFLCRTGGEKLTAFIDTIVGSDKVEFDFVAEYFVYCKEDQKKSLSLNRILQLHPEYIDRLVSESNYQDAKIKEQLSIYLHILLEEDALQPSVGVVDYISGCEDLPAMLHVASIERSEQMEKLIKRLGLKMRVLNFECARLCGLLDVLIQCDAYEINQEMLTGILSEHSVDVSSFERRGYSIIKKSPLPSLAKYVDDNFSEYLAHVYVTANSEKAEDEDVLISLLNNNGHSFADKSAFIRMQFGSAAINEITKITTAESLNLVLASNLMSATWANVLWCFEYWDKVSESLSAYLNNASVYSALANAQCNQDWDSVKSFALAIANSTILSEESVLCILKGLPSGRISDYTGENATPKRVDTISRARKIVFSPALYASLKKLDNESHTTLAACCPGAFVKNIPHMEIDANDAVLIFQALENRRHDSLTIFINALCDLITSGDQRLVKCVATYVSESNYNNVDGGVLKACFSCFDNVPLQCKIIRKISNDKADASELLSLMREPYQSLSSPSHRPLLAYWDGLEPFLAWLKQLSIVSSYTNEESGIRVNIKRDV